MSTLTNISRNSKLHLHIEQKRKRKQGEKKNWKSPIQHLIYHTHVSVQNWMARAVSCLKYRRNMLSPHTPFTPPTHPPTHTMHPPLYLTYFQQTPVLHSTSTPTPKWGECAHPPPAMSTNLSFNRISSVLPHCKSKPTSNTFYRTESCEVQSLAGLVFKIL